MSASNQEVINALASIANFTLTDKTSFGALFGGSNGGSSNVASAKGVGNTSFGNSALSGLIDTSKQNTAFGHRSQLSTESDSNTSFGFESMLFNWMGSENTAFGALYCASIAAPTFDRPFEILSPCKYTLSVIY